MAGLLDLLTKTIGSNEIQTMSRKIGADEGQAKSAVEAALPMLLGAISRNASSTDGAASLFQALTRDHDGSVLDRPDAVVQDPAAAKGDGILRHVLGARRSAVESGLSGATGLDKGKAGQLLSMLAPMVMGALGRTQRSSGLDARGVASMLGDERRTMESRQPQAMGLLGSLLDADGDGDVDGGDLARKGLGALGKLFGK